MPSTHTSLFYHFVFSTKNRYPFLGSELRPTVHSYLGGILRDVGGIPLEIGGVADHVHVLSPLKPTQSVSAVLREMKRGSSEWIHHSLRVRKFAWQTGYGAFSVSPGDVPGVRRYISTQVQHHSTRTFQEEYVEFLRRYGIDFDQAYLW